MNRQVLVENCASYEIEYLNKTFDKFDDLFQKTIKPGQHVALKPNWIAHQHKHRPGEWESVITHPNFISATIKKVIQFLGNSGKITIADAPQTDTIFSKILEKLPVDDWEQTCNQKGIELEIIDLRDNEWTNEGDVIVERRKLEGDPRGSVEYNLRNDLSEFHNHKPSRMGYYGADCDISETTRAHTNGRNLYRISKTMIEADVFINLPKLKTHKKAGITCSLKNLVGINTYKNFLPHHTEGTPLMGGDQFPRNNFKGILEVFLLEGFKKILAKYDKLSKLMVPVKKAGKVTFGETRETIRGGNWYGNDTLWRMIHDLNKLLLYGKPDGTLRKDHKNEKKKYLTFVDGIIAGEGNGPEAPSPFASKIIIGGSNPLAVDCVAAKMMRFNYKKIPSLKNAFAIKKYPVSDFNYDDIIVKSHTFDWCNGSLIEIPNEKCYSFKPHFGWIGHIECI